MMPAPWALPLALMVTPPGSVKCTIFGAAVVPSVAMPLIWLSVCSSFGRARRSVIIWFNWVVDGAAGDVLMLGTMGGPGMKPRPVTLSFCRAERLVIVSWVLVSLRVEMPGTGGLVVIPPVIR